MGRGIVSRGACLPCDPLRFSPRPADLCLAHISPPTPVHPPLLHQPHQPIDSPQYTDQSTDPPFISLRRAHFRVTARQHARRAGEGRSNKERLWCSRVSTETASQPRRRGRRQEAGGRRDRTKDFGARASPQRASPGRRSNRDRRPPRGRPAATSEPAHHFRVILPPTLRRPS